MYMLQEIRTEVEDAYLEVLNHTKSHYPKDYAPLIARGEYSRHSAKGVSNYMLDYMGDIHKDTTRQKFYIAYLNRNYSKEGFYYINSEEDFFALNVEIMIFSQIWESTCFLKYLARIAAIISGEGYKWNMEIPSTNLYKFIRDGIIMPLTNNNFKLGILLQNNYNSIVRNAFAHSQYEVDMERQRITFVHLCHKNSQTQEISFEQFQNMFLYAIVLDNFSLRILRRIGMYYLESGHTDMGVVKLPNGNVIHIKIKERFGGPYYYTER